MRLDGKVAIVTGAGRGIGRADALALARFGAAVVVNDVGASSDGQGRDPGPAQDVVDEIISAGGRAIADMTDITDWEAASEIVAGAVSAFGTVDILVNNAAISRFAGTIDVIAQDDWMRTIAVNLSGTAALTHWVAALWRCEGARAGRAIVNTVSPMGLTSASPSRLPNAPYTASKAAIAAFTLDCAVELADLAVRVNAIAPVARTRVSEFVAPHLVRAPETGFDRMGPDNVAVVVAWLVSPGCRFTGRIFSIKGGDLGLLKGWSVDREFSNGDAQWTADALDNALKELA